MLLNSNQSMHAPFTQEPPLMTEDMHEERLQAVEAFGDSLILHYLETLRPHQLLEQMMCTAFSAAADTLAQTNYGGLKQMITKLDQLYLTMTSALRPLQANHLSAHTDTIEDIRRLSGVFEHVEKLLTITASLHRKFLHAPRLSEAIFRGRDCCNFYFPRMGTSSSGDNTPKV